MMSALIWIWGLLKTHFETFRKLCQWFFDLSTSIVTWIVVILTLLVRTAFGYIGDFLEGLFENVVSVTSGLPSAPLAVWLARDVVALDVAWTCLLVFVSAWVASRLTRFAFGAIRLILDVL